MTIRSLLLRAVLMAVALLVACAPVSAGSQVPMKVYIYDMVVDEHNTNAFYNSAQFCPGAPTFFQTAMVRGDSPIFGSPVFGPSTAYDGFGAFWQSVSSLSSTVYQDNTFCGANCVHALLNANNKILSLDTRGTIGPRKLTLDFSQPCDVLGCPSPAGSPRVFGGSVTTPMLVNISLTFPYTSMGVCTSAGCPEAERGFAKIWFSDPSEPDVTWRVDHANIRMLRMSETTWYIIADGCDGTQVAGLSKLIGNRTRPKTVFNGYYLMPFFIEAVKK